MRRILRVKTVAAQRKAEAVHLSGILVYELAEFVFSSAKHQVDYFFVVQYSPLLSVDYLLNPAKLFRSYVHKCRNFEKRFADTERFLKKICIFIKVYHFDIFQSNIKKRLLP